MAMHPIVVEIFQSGDRQAVHRAAPLAKNSLIVGASTCCRVTVILQELYNNPSNIVIIEISVWPDRAEQSRAVADLH